MHTDKNMHVLPVIAHDAASRRDSRAAVHVKRADEGGCVGPDVPVEAIGGETHASSDAGVVLCVADRSVLTLLSNPNDGHSPQSCSRLLSLLTRLENVRLPTEK